MNIDQKEAQRIATLANIDLSSDEAARMAAEMTKILEYIDQLREIAIDDVTLEALQPTPMRDDQPLPSLDLADVSANAPAWRDGLFVVPRVIAGE